jgi:DNA ligase (NAD+)
MNEGYIHEFADIYHLKEHFDVISQMEGFGEKSVANMDRSIEKSRNVHPVNFIFALCIPLIGVDAAKRIVGSIGFDAFLQRMEQGEGFDTIEGIGEERSNSILKWYEKGRNREGLAHLLTEVTIEEVKPRNTGEGTCVGLTFVITGDVHHYKNRDEFKAYVESQGGKVAGSVSGKTAYLVNNDVESTSSKNRKAKDLGVPIISEDEFVARFGLRE